MIKNLLKKSLFVRRITRNLRLKTSQPSWSLSLEKNRSLWNSALVSRSRPRILIATSVGAHLPGTVLESLLAVALTLRKAEVHILLCDSVLPACQNCEIMATIDEKGLARCGPQKYLCRACFYYTNKMFKSLKLRVHRYSEFLSDKDIKIANQISMTTDYSKIRDYSLESLAVGEHAMAGALRFYARGNLEGNHYAEVVLRRYFKAALLTTFVAQHLLEKYQFECAVFHHGIYVPQGLIGEVCRSKNVRVVNWNPAYRKQCFIFSHNDSYHHTLMTESLDKWENIPWNQSMETELMDYLKSRWYGTKDWIWFYEKPQVDIDAITEELGIDFSKSCIGMLTNVIWDAQLHYPANIFSNMIDWVIQTIAYFEERPDLQLIIRVHPAEIRATIPSRQPIIDEIKKKFSILPKNIFIIPPESHISTYPVMAKCNAVIIYGTKTGVELTTMGIPVIVAGEAWIRNKGITIDPKTKEEYFEVLDSLPLANRMSENLVQRSYKYAYHFFFRRMIPLPQMKPTSGWPPYRIEISKFDNLLPGKTLGLDVVCDGIIKGADFVYPSEQYLI